MKDLALIEFLESRLIAGVVRSVHIIGITVGKPLLNVMSLGALEVFFRIIVQIFRDSKRLAINLN